MLSELRFPRAKSCDLVRIVEVENEAFRPGVAWSPERLSRDLQDPQRETYLAQDPQEHILGYAMLNLTQGGPGVVRLDSLAVSSRARGRGVGEQLLRLSIDRSRELGAQRMQLEVEVGNLAAEKLYSKYGFAPTQFLSGHYPGNDGRRMELVLDSYPRQHYRNS